MRFVKLIIATIILAAVHGCISVQPPANPADPLPVYLADYGVHSSLILPTPDDNYVEYCWGDWDFAVENRDFFLIDGPRALFISFQSGFGRRFMPVNPLTGNPEVPHSNPSLKHLSKFFADRDKIYAVVKELDARYKAGKGPPKTNEENNNVYVKDSQHYWLLHNCNHLTTDLLRELDCKVDGIVVTSAFVVNQPMERINPDQSPMPNFHEPVVNATINGGGKE